ncbi:lauroyl-Kdo(2)-lipid IV(A) myristoyltransferase [Vibrio ordalii]|uniref:lauroyl-Kdo(2)-lipid IV(A) myristoyltransferase n=1 Tax=Vibrio ordalii TaxID=28174 RepID=UPI0002482FF2|nr:lauroyl-Kdo(2)-lipid IV(A) myristoyltransferase [Vibrio ordalii]
MSNNENSTDKHLHNPTFQWSFLHPKHWATWIGIFFAALFAFMPPVSRDRLARKLSTFAVRKNGRVVRRARVNLAKCFPEKSTQERQAILEETFATAAQYMLGYSELLVRSTQHNLQRGKLIGEHHLLPLLDQGERVILLVPHSWAIDYAAVMLAARGYKVANIMKPQRNPIGDWLMHVQRMQYGGRIFTREAGIKPFLRSVQNGYVGYWVPDEDHGAPNSVFVPFFGTEKATLKGFGKMAKLCKAHVVPLMSVYNNTTHQYEVHILPALENFPTGDEEQDARAMNKAIEDLVTPRPEQYMWNLSLLKTQRDGSEIYDNSHHGDQS